MLQDLFYFLRTTFGHWQTWASGGGFGGLLVILLGIYERVWGRPVSNRTYIGIFIGGFLFVALFVAWREEHSELIKERRNAPSLAAEIHFAWATYVPAQDITETFLLVSLTNSGTPSFAEGWRLSFRTTDQNLENLPYTQIPKELTLLNLSKNGAVDAVFHQEHSLPEKAIRQVGRDEIVRGWIRFRLPGNVKDSVITGRGELELRFHDARRVSYTTRFRSGGPSPTPYFPGVEQPVR